MLTKDKAKNILDIYKEAWINKDPDKILTIFTKDAVYHEKPLEKPFIGHVAIKKYWIDKVVYSQDKIRFNLLNLYIDGDTCIAEWEVSFIDLNLQVKKHLKEVAIMEFKGKLIKSFREYWYSKTYPYSG